MMRYINQLNYALGWARNGKYLTLCHFVPIKYCLHIHFSNELAVIKMSTEDFLICYQYSHSTSWIINLLSNHVLQLSRKIMHQVIKLLTHFVRVLDKVHSIDH